MTVRIRPAQPGDAGPVRDIYAHHVAHGRASFDTIGPDVSAITEKIAGSVEAGWPFLIADDGGVAGYAYAAPFRERPAYAATCEDSIYIHPDHMRRGIGAMLMSALIEAAEGAGFRQMIAVIGGGEPASVALHEGAGFTHAGRMRAVGYKHGRWLDTVYMQRALGEGNSTPPGTIAA